VTLYIYHNIISDVYKRAQRAYNVRYSKKKIVSIIGTRIIYSAGDYNFYNKKVQSSAVLLNNPDDGLRDNL